MRAEGWAGQSSRQVSGKYLVNQFVFVGNLPCARRGDLAARNSQRGKCVSFCSLNESLQPPLGFLLALDLVQFIFMDFLDAKCLNTGRYVETYRPHNFFQVPVPHLLTPRTRCEDSILKETRQPHRGMDLHYCSGVMSPEWLLFFICSSRFGAWMRKC